MPLSESHVGGIRWTGGSAAAISDDVTYTGTAGGSLSVTTTGAVTDEEHDIGFDKDTLKLIVITVRGNATQAFHIETNASDHTGGQELIVPAGGGVMFWSDQSPLANPISDDVTKMFFTHSGTESVDVKVRVLSGTP